MKSDRDLDFQRFYDGEGPVPTPGAEDREALMADFALVSERLSRLAYEAGREYGEPAASAPERVELRPRMYIRVAWGLTAAAALSACSAYVLQRLWETVEAMSYFFFLLI